MQQLACEMNSGRAATFPSVPDELESFWRRHRQLPMNLDASDSKPRHAALPCAEQVVLAAHPQVLLDGAEAVSVSRMIASRALALSVAR